MRLKSKQTVYNRAQWDAFDRVLMLLNGLDVPDNMTADQMRRRIYGLVIEMVPKC